MISQCFKSLICFIFFMQYIINYFDLEVKYDLKMFMEDHKIHLFTISWFWYFTFVI